MNWFDLHTEKCFSLPPYIYPNANLVILNDSGKAISETKANDKLGACLAMQCMFLLYAIRNAMVVILFELSCLQDAYNTEGWVWRFSLVNIVSYSSIVLVILGLLIRF